MIPNELELLRQHKFELYMHKQCLKMCKYVQYTMHVEILAMKAEFHLDDNMNMWLVDVTQIAARKLSKHSLIAL
jgi:hypothetical protein